MSVARIALVASIGFAAVAFGAAPREAEAQGLDVCYLRNTVLDSATVRPSPLGATTVTLGGAEATLCYSRPSVRGRMIMGELVPYGTPWRMGANEATGLHLPFAVTIGTVALEPGVYSLYAVPGEGDWTIVVNGNAERWGIPINGDVKSADLGSFQIPASTTDNPIEELTFTWVPDGPDSGRIVMTWEHTQLDIPVRRTGG